MASVRFAGATRRYPGSDRPAVAALDLQIDDGELLVLVGPSGCGKTTSLRMVAGLELVDEGAVFIGDIDVTGVAPHDRDVAMVFQSYALYAHMTVADNIAFPLKMAGVSRELRRARALEVARMLELQDHLDRKPRALSGGQRQRVAMARAIIREPRVFLLDEPLSNLDAQLRVQTRTQIASLQRRLGVTTIHVTHDQVEAMTMGDRVAVMFNGRLAQVDAPASLYRRPRDMRVARFIGSPPMNLHEVDVVEGKADLHGHMLALPRDAAGAEGRVVVGFRPDAVEVCGEGGEGLPVTVEVVEELGAEAYVMASFHGHEGVFDLADVVARVDPRRVPRRGERLRLRIREDELHLFSPVTGERLNR